MAHVHQALVQVAVLKLRRYKLDQTAKLIGQRTCMATRLVALVESLLLDRYHEVNQESAYLYHGLHDKLACSSLRIRHVLGQRSVELLKILLHLLLRFGIDFGALLKYLLDLVAGTLKLVAIASGLDVVINGSRQDHVNIELAGKVDGRHELLLDQTSRLLLLRRASKLIGEGQVQLGDEIVTLCERRVNLQVQLLVHLDGRLEGLERLRVHLVLLVRDGQLVPGEDILGAQLLLQSAIVATLLILVERIPKDV